MSSKENWTTIESDPGVFTELLQRMGVQSVQWRAEKDDRPVDHGAVEYVWFANQVINNACATQAILSILFNCPEIELGPELTNLKSFSIDFPPNLKGLTISNSAIIRSVHNSFRPPETYVSDEDMLKDKDDADVYHFIGYVPVNGILYELDGLKEGPIKLCDCHEGDWIRLVTPFIQARIEQYARNEIRFNLMAIIKNRSEVIEEQLKELEEAKIALMEELSRDPAAEREEKIQLELAEKEEVIMKRKESLEQERVKFKNWKEENVRRKHNYIPFLFNFLKILAEKDQLKDLICEAREKQENTEKEAREKGPSSQSQK